MILIVSSTGILIYKTHCACIGSEQVSLYVMPDTCEDDFHVHHTHKQDNCCEIETTENNCHECSAINNECGCESPKVEFFKLVNQISEDEISFIKVQSVKISEIVASILFSVDEVLEKEPVEFYTDPPPKISNSKSFLIEVHQLKIPYIA